MFLSAPQHQEQREAFLHQHKNLLQTSWEQRKHRHEDDTQRDSATHSEVSTCCTVAISQLFA